jgi:hypothetical protein
MLTSNVQNRLQESLVLFDSICNSRWFVKTDMILFLTNGDTFAEKLQRNPLVSVPTMLSPLPSLALFPFLYRLSGWQGR